MAIEWVHEDLRLGAGGYQYSAKPCRAAQNKQRPLHRSALSLQLIIIISALITVAIAVPLLKIKSRSFSNSEIVTSSPFTPNPVYRLDSKPYRRMTQLEKRKMSAQVHFISELIQTTRNKRVDPYKIAWEIVNGSRKANFDPLFVASVILEESSFRKNAKSPVGALGLMQIMPRTGKYISNIENIEWKGTRHLTNPEYNIKLGIAYIKYLNEMFNNDVHKTLIAYNWGPTNLNQALTSRSKGIPSSPKQYSRNIQRHYSTWKDDFEVKLPGYQHMQISMHMDGFKG